MRLDLYFSKGDFDKFANSCEAVIRNVGRATKRATEQACQEVLRVSLQQVPRETSTLASTAFYEVSRRTAVKGYTYEGVVGYAGGTGVGAEHDAFNENSAALASQYAMIVHEDLSCGHPNGGKAKFLEDPLREYGQNNFKRVATKHWQYALDESGGTIPYTE